MNSIAIWNFRNNLSSYLNDIKKWNKGLVFWNRKKKEFLITVYPNMGTDLDLFKYNEIIEEKVTQKDYYDNLQNTMSDWLSEEHDDLFK